MTSTTQRFSLFDAGDIHASPGSYPWACAVRLEVLGALHRSESSAEQLQGWLSAMREREGWRVLSDIDGTPFASFEAFCIAGEPYGLGYDVSVLEKIIRDRHTAQIRAQTPGKLRDRPGQPPKNGNDVTILEKRGNTQDYLIARLARDAPHELARLQRGEYTSARQAALAAGLVKPRVSIEPTVAGFARAARRHLSPQQLDDLFEALSPL